MSSTDLGLDRRRPILLTGMPRSGTTWVGRILTAGGEVGYLNEPFNLDDSPGSFRVPAEHWYAYITTETEAQFLPALARGLHFDYPLARELRRCRNRTDLHHTLKSWRDFAGSRGRRPLVKEPHAVFSVGWFVERLGSDVVFMVRQPLAVVSSWKRLGWSFDFANLLDQPALMRDWLSPFESEMRAALSPSWTLVERVALFWKVIYSIVDNERFPNVQLVRHEDLSADPEDGYIELFRRLELAYTAKVAAAIRRSTGAGNPAEVRVETPHETELNSKANLENWRHRLTDHEVERIGELTSATAARFYPELSQA
jgi:Sulfotransferase domain